MTGLFCSYTALFCLKRTLKLTEKICVGVAIKQPRVKASCWISFSAGQNQTKMTSPKQSRERFQGCLVGALVGDCLGSPFEGLTRSSIDRKNIEEVIGISSVKSAKKKTRKNNDYYRYTDDFAMTRSVCRSLIEKNGFHAADMASKFLEEFLKEKDRGYGSGMFIIFDKWKESGTAENPFIPALEQYGGDGSYGNGAAMRVAPVALFAKNDKDVIELAKNTALLTHSNKHGYNGAILQALSVHRALNYEGKVDKKQFLQELIETMSIIENVDVASIVESKDGGDNESLKSVSQSERKSRRKDFTFTSQLLLMSSLLTDPNSKTDPLSIIEAFGNDISAQEAVIVALYSFLRNCDEDFVETLMYAVSLGGDTDTIATMACAIAGAYFGSPAIPSEWKSVCEGLNDAVKFADQLFDRTSKQ